MPHGDEGAMFYAPFFDDVIESMHCITVRHGVLIENGDVIGKGFVLRKVLEKYSSVIRWLLNRYFAFFWRKKKIKSSF